MASDPDSIKIAQIEQRVISIDEWKDTHDKRDDTRFDKSFEFVKEGFIKIEDHLDKIHNRLDTLWDEKNKKEGAFSASKLGIFMIWSAFTVVVNYIIETHK